MSFSYVIVVNDNGELKSITMAEMHEAETLNELTGLTAGIEFAINTALDVQYHMKGETRNER